MSVTASPAAKRPGPSHHRVHGGPLVPQPEIQLDARVPLPAVAGLEAQRATTRTCLGARATSEARSRSSGWPNMYAPPWMYTTTGNSVSPDDESDDGLDGRKMFSRSVPFSVSKDAIGQGTYLPSFWASRTRPLSTGAHHCAGRNLSAVA
ncbi:hypothetical protein MHUMG1_00935 [Metarhizium humberi]|uniref:Uncharacterized protein n=1 Tax=Metarhizium humberi TaxID=2596975 RepID=A0A9P8SBP1_9HYPO|nr:hypothetical protein MHUMG1_00935 [Metarhizium humberi]